MGSVKKTMATLRHHPDILNGVADHVVSDLRQYEDWFTIEPPTLKKITDHFVDELNEGLTMEGGNIVSTSPFDLNVRDLLTRHAVLPYSP